jgi:hypothetical protein
MKNPQEFMDALQSTPHNYKLKGVGPPKYHLGGDFFRDSDGTLCYGAQTYVKRLVQDYVQLFGEEPTNASSPLPKGDHPELDTSDPCGPDDITKFQSLIGALQWTISLCRFDIANAVMTLSRYRAAPLVGHLERAKRIVGYIESKQNPSDILTKSLDHATAWPHIDTLLFRKGDTMSRNDDPRNLRGVSSCQVAQVLVGPTIATIANLATYGEATYGETTHGEKVQCVQDTLHPSAPNPTASNESFVLSQSQNLNSYLHFPDFPFASLSENHPLNNL